MKKVPKLRFPQFEGEWEERELGDITKITDGVHFTPNYVEEGIPFWSVETIASGANPKYITEEAHEEAKKRCHPQKGDILLTRIGTLAKPKLIDWDDEFSIYVSVALIKKSKYFDSLFIKNYFETQEYQKEFYSKSLLTATPKKINMEDLKNTKVRMPSANEQYKIASFFSLIDKKVESQQQKYELIQEYKKGMMQKIFSQEIRFNDENGDEFPEWESKRLNELIFEHKIRNYDMKYDKKDVLSVSGDYGIVNQIEYLGRSYAGESVDNYHVVHKGDVVYTKSPLKSNPYGIIKANKGEAGIVSTLYAVYSCKKTILPEYLDYYFQLKDNTNRYIRPLVNKGAKNDMKINNEYFLTDSIIVPSLEEQKKIVKFFEIIDKKVDKEKERLDVLNVWKKGFLQQMFV